MGRLKTPFSKKNISNTVGIHLMVNSGMHLIESGLLAELSLIKAMVCLRDHHSSSVENLMTKLLFLALVGFQIISSRVT